MSSAEYCAQHAKSKAFEDRDNQTNPASAQPIKKLTNWRCILNMLNRTVKDFDQPVRMHIFI